MNRIHTICAVVALHVLGFAVGAAEQPGVDDLIKILDDPAAKIEAKRDACAQLCRMETAAKAATRATRANLV